MKKLLTLALVLCAGAAMAGFLSSGSLTADGVISSTGTNVRGVLISTDGTNNVTVDLYDNPSAASGTKLFHQIVTGSNNSGGALSLNVYASQGVYLDITTDGTAEVIVYKDQ